MVATKRSRSAREAPEPRGRGHAAKGKAAVTKAGGKKKAAAEPAGLSAAQLEKIQKVMDAHALLRGVGKAIEQQIERHPMQRAPDGGETTFKPIEIEMPEDLYEHSRIGRGKYASAWHRTKDRRGEVVLKRERLQRAKALHKQALLDEDDDEDAQRWSQLSKKRQAKYLEMAGGADDAHDDEGAGEEGGHAEDADAEEEEGAPSSTLKAESCSLVMHPAVAHETLALPKEGPCVMRCFTLHGKQEVHAPIIKLQTRYNYARQTLTVKGKVQYKKWEARAEEAEEEEEASAQ